MPPDAAIAGIRVTDSARLPAIWRRPLLLLGLAWAGLIAMFAQDWADMAAQWWDISTYNHILLVPLIVAWLVSLRRGEVLRLVPQDWWPGLVVFAGACLMWVLGTFAGLSLARQLAAVMMLQGAVLAILGPRVSAALTFPLAYMVFLVPAGEELVPLLQLVTARMTMGLLALSGIPALLEGVFITTPAGYFKVAEACSGIKFLIAMGAFSALAANLCFRAWPRRLVFVGAALAISVLANGLRAWGTIVIAEHRGIEFASGFDHIFYGWIFFAVVIAIVVAAGWRWFDRSPEEPQIDADRIARSPALARLNRLRMAPNAVFAMLATLSIAALLWAAAGLRGEAQVPARIDLAEVAGWRRVDYAATERWQPLHGGADHRLLGTYADDAGHRVDVSYALYGKQGEGSEAGGFGQGAVPRDTAWAWAEPEPTIAGSTGQRIAAPGPVVRVAHTWYRSGDTTTGSNLRLKIANVVDRLLLRRRTTAVLIVSAEDRAGRPARDAVERFIEATGDPGAWMDRLAQPR